MTLGEYRAIMQMAVDKLVEKGYKVDYVARLGIVHDPESGLAERDHCESFIEGFIAAFDSAIREPTTK